jgi:DNA ligase-1
VAGFSDTIDVVPIGAWYGNGRKAQKKFLSPVLLAVYDEEEDVYRSISRCMSFTDAMYDAMRDFYFYGIPYPAGVGMADDPKTEKANEAGLSTVDEETHNDSEEAEVDIGTEEAQWVNCYPSRPSTALIVTNESPPIWFKPMEVFEVSFADLSLSKQHTAAAGLVDAERGVALRFPRFKRRRPDKRIDQATTTTQIAELFAKQTKQGKS